ncbi:hypothetical protein GALL_480190 [mine drainage metagenome]|uniref:Uncharacterized protein n=1 Tax=mine drainage metagenome TaxID=410659 RepID=A0A1J5PYM1_9ZZZZ
MHCGRLVRLARQFESAGVRCVQTGEHVKKCGFSGTVGANKAIHLATHDLDADIAQGLQATKAFRHISDVEYYVCHIV